MMHENEGCEVKLRDLQGLLEIAERKADVLTALLMEANAEYESALARMTTSEHNFRAIFETAPEPIYLIDANTRKILDCNDFTLAWLGYSREELLVMAADSIVDSKVEAGGDLESLCSGRIAVAEWGFRKKDGTLSVAEVTGTPLEYNGSKCFAVLARDITVRKRAEEVLRKSKEDLEISVLERTEELRKANEQLRLELIERKRAEEALRASEIRYRSLFEESRDGVYSRLKDGEITDANQSFLDIFGYTREEMIGKNVRELYADPADCTRFQEEIEKKGFVKDFEITHHKKDGSEVEILVTSSVYLGEDGNIAGYRGILRDVTHVKDAAEALRESEERFRRIFEQGPLGLAIMGLDYRWIAVNARLCEITGYSEDELTRLKFSDITHPDDLERSLAEADKLVRGEIPYYNIEKRYIKKSGEVCWVHITVSAVRDGQGKMLYLISMFEDITDRRQMEGIALQSARLRAVADLSSGVAHHFNNLLQIIMAATSLTLMRLKSGDFSKIKTTLERMLEATSLGAETVRRLQTFANVRTDVVGDEESIFDVARTVTNAAEVLRPLWKSDYEKKGIRIDMQWELEAGCLVKGKENELFEAMVNLIKNAVEAMPAGGNLKINAYKEAGEVVIKVRDTGIGIAEDDLPRVFQPFWSSKGVAIGKGMGLAVTHGLVKRHGGSISVQSKEGEGATFTVRLPLAQDEAANAQWSVTGREGGQLAVLVIDDEERIAELLEQICAAAGHRVFKAISGQDGLAIFDKEPVDVVICDLGMPSMNGWDVGKAIQSMCRNKGTTKPPFVILTGWVEQELEEEKIAESGVDAVVAKPIDSAAIISTVQKMAARRWH